MKIMSKKLLWIFVATLYIYVFTQKMCLAKRHVFGISIRSEQKCINNYQVRLLLLSDRPEQVHVCLIVSQIWVGTVLLTNLLDSLTKNINFLNWRLWWAKAKFILTSLFCSFAYIRWSLRCKSAILSFTVPFHPSLITEKLAVKTSCRQ